MKFLQVILSLCLLLLVPLPLLVVESSPTLNDTASVNNITRGSSLFSNDSAAPYWLSPSGNIAFGFYQLPCRPSPSNCIDRYVVGIWLVKSSQKTLVWSANRDKTPLHKPSSVLFTNEGKLVLRVLPENQDKPLIPDIQEPVSYAKMHDNGNFVLYGSESQIVWQSFDHPTDTILGGQNLKDGIELVSSVSMFDRGSGTYHVSVRQRDGLVTIYRKSALLPVRLISRGFGDSVSSPVTLNLETSGKLYVVGSDDVVLGYLYPNKNQQLEENDDEDCIYRATLEPRGDFVLYKERIDGNDNSSSNVVLRRWPSAQKFYESICFELLGALAAILAFIVAVFLVILICYCTIRCFRQRRREQRLQSSQPAAVV